MPDPTRSPATEAAVDALQTAVLLVGALRRALLAELDHLATLKVALERATAALRPTGGRHV